MYARFALLAAAALISGAAVAADAPKAPVHPAAQPQQRPAEVVFASADEAQTPAPTDSQTSPTPRRPRVARVTTCRCGDQENQEQ